jgi:hypothetical protein
MFSFPSLMLLVARKKTMGANTAKLPKIAQGDRESHKDLFCTSAIKLS